MVERNVVSGNLLQSALFEGVGDVELKFWVEGDVTRQCQKTTYYRIALS